MKYFAVLLLAIAACIATTSALKNKLCGQKPFKNSDGFRTCMGYFLSWSYVKESNECVNFVYGGCFGNGNRFESLADCENKFGIISSSKALKQDRCGLLHSKNGDNGIMCETYFPSWTYKADTNECIYFVYGGCGGNANRFESQEECEREYVCQLEHSVDGYNGTACFAHFPSWSYNADTNECEKFIYGGCGGNANRFETLEDCERTCRK
ncbi:actinia tenebrosa protease inhibitors-like [Musca vetustissima]|uniref:actinia tenebrosa protease inhibitors-like n=1 Tax=Musca vetustissima TaxID=27455 RepID=UPI002AB69030|nr:actinia tenebrosa protease inhibitors-like [Musca vetustissima]